MFFFSIFAACDIVTLKVTLAGFSFWLWATGSVCFKILIPHVGKLQQPLSNFRVMKTFCSLKKYVLLGGFVALKKKKEQKDKLKHNPLMMGEIPNWNNTVEILLYGWFLNITKCSDNITTFFTRYLLAILKTFFVIAVDFKNCTC